MMKNIDFKNMSNNDIKIELKNLENKYEKIKSQVLKLVNEMKELDSEYMEGNKELINRSKGIF